MKKLAALSLICVLLFTVNIKASSGSTHNASDQKQLELAELITRPGFLNGDFDKEANDFLATIEDPHIRMNLAIGINTMRIVGLRNELRALKESQEKIIQTFKTVLCKQQARIKHLENSCCTIQ